MLNKKGIGNEIDWIIGIGLFMLSTVFIFIIFKPGIQKVYDSETLLDIIQEGFNQNTEFNITNIPIFIYPSTTDYKKDLAVVLLTDKKIELTCDKNCASKEDSKVKDFFANKGEPNIKIFFTKKNENENPPKGPGGLDGNIDKDKIDPKEFCKNNQNKCNERDKKIGENRDNVKEFLKGDQILYLKDNTGLKLPVRLSDGDANKRIPIKTKYLVTASDKNINFYETPGNLKDWLKNSLDFKACLGVGQAPWPYPEVAKVCPVIYEIGVPETIEGIDLAAFPDNNPQFKPKDCQTTTYDCLKEKWKFPLSKEFKIKIQSLPIGKPPNIDQSFPDEISPPSNINIFVRQFNSFLLTEDGTRIPVKITISTW